MSHTASAKRNSKSNASSTRSSTSLARERQFVVCIRNGGYKASLELRKVYEAIRDPKAAERHFLRIVDESGEDYLYPENYFLALELNEPVKKALRRAS